MNLETLFRQPRALPTIPKVMQELITSFNDEDVAVARLVDLISADQVLSANVLRMANSAYFEVPYTVATVADAVVKLGFTNVRSLVISIGLTGSFKAIPGIDGRQFWRHSLHILNFTFNRSGIFKRERGAAASPTANSSRSLSAWSDNDQIRTNRLNAASNRGLRSLTN